MTQAAGKGVLRMRTNCSTSPPGWFFSMVQLSKHRGPHCEIHTHQLPYTGIDIASVEAAAAAVSAVVAAAAESATRLLRMSWTCGRCCCCHCALPVKEAAAVFDVGSRGIAPCAAAFTSRADISGNSKLLLGPLLLLLGLGVACAGEHMRVYDMLKSLISRGGWVWELL
jgi:hypothetical protein